jgi:hypothetical protein
MSTKHNTSLAALGWGPERRGLYERGACFRVHLIGGNTVGGNRSKRYSRHDPDESLNHPFTRTTLERSPHSTPLPRLPQEGLLRTLEREKIDLRIARRKAERTRRRGSDGAEIEHPGAFRSLQRTMTSPARMRATTSARVTASTSWRAERKA